MALAYGQSIALSEEKKSRALARGVSFFGTTSTNPSTYFAIINHLQYSLIKP